MLSEKKLIFPLEGTMPYHLFIDHPLSTCFFLQRNSTSAEEQAVIGFMQERYAIRAVEVFIDNPFIALKLTERMRFDVSIFPTEMQNYLLTKGCSVFDQVDVDVDYKDVIDRMSKLVLLVDWKEIFKNAGKQ
jgi:hypothetical protein